jgi:hypothetical protein
MDAVENTSICTTESDYNWTYSSYKLSPFKGIVVAFSGFVVLVLGTSILHSILMGLIGSILLIISLKEYIFPFKYVLDNAKATVKCGGIPISEIAWDKVKTVYHIPGGIKLSPFIEPSSSKMENFRGVELRFSEKDRTHVEYQVQELSGMAIKQIAQL